MPTATKIELCERLVSAGVRQLEATYFVAPKWVPQMSDAADVMSADRAPPQAARLGATRS